MIRKDVLLMCVLIYGDECKGDYVHNMTFDEFKKRHIFKARYHLRTNLKGYFDKRLKTPELLKKMYIDLMKCAFNADVDIPNHVIKDNQFRRGLFSEVKAYIKRNKIDLRLSKTETTN